VRRRVLKPAAERAGVPWVGFHTFRHTCAPHDSADAYVEVAEVQAGGLVISRKFKAWAALSTGERVHSKNRAIIED
jgi:integrase